MTYYFGSLKEESTSNDSNNMESENDFEYSFAVKLTDTDKVRFATIK